MLLTAADTLLLLWLSRFGIRALEGFVLSLITIMGGCFLVEILLAKPDFTEMLGGLVPRLNDQSLYVAIGILGATVMPHNLYLHSALVQTRRIEASLEAKRTACRFNLVDSVIALNGALLVNAAILILAAATFFKRGIVVTEIQQAHLLLAPLLGTTLAGVLFGVALLASGQSSTMTGTMAGQIVMEGFLSFRMRPWLRTADHPHGGHHPGGHHHLRGRRPGHLQAADPQPGDSQHATALRGHSADPLHQRPPEDGRLRQPALGAPAAPGWRRP